jgi:phage-related protein
MSHSFSAAGASAEKMTASVQRLRDSSGRFVSAGAGVEKAAGGMNGAMGNAAGGMLGSITSMKGGLIGLAVGAGVAAAAVGAAMASMTMKGVQAAASYEQTTIAFTSSFKSMGRSAEDAQVYLKNLRDFAAKTPFTLTGLLDSVRGLIAVGNSPEKVIQSMLPAIGDMASMMGVGEDAIAGVVFAMRQMTGAPRVLAQDLYQVQNALPGFNSKAALAKDAVLALAGGFKKGDMAGLTKAMESGLISGKMAVDALIRGMQKFPGAAGMMKKQSETMNGVMSTFKDNINNALIDGFAPAIPIISKALLRLMPVVENLTKGFAKAMGPELAKAINQVVPALTKMSEQAGPMLGAFIGKILPLMTPMIELFARLGVILGGAVMVALNALGPLFTTVVNALSQIFAALTPVIGALANVGTALGGSTGYFKIMIQQIVLMVQILAPWIALLLQGIAILIQFANKILGVLRPIQQVTAGVGVMKVAVANNMSVLIAVVQKLAYAFGFASSFIKQAITGIGKVVAPMADVVASGLDKVKGWFNEAGNWISKIWARYGSRFVSATSSFLSSAVRLISGFAGKMFRAAWELANKLTGGLLAGLDVSMPSFLKNLMGWTSNAIAKASADGAIMANQGGRAVGEAFANGVRDGMASLPGNLKYLAGYGPGGNLGPKGQKTPPPMKNDGLFTGGGSAGGGGGGGGADKAAEEQKKWYQTIQDLGRALRTFSKDTKLSVGEINTVIQRSRGIFDMFGMTFKQGSALIRTALNGMMKDGKVTAEEIAALANKLSGALKKFNNAAASQIDTIKKTFAKFVDLTLRAFDAETQRQSQGIRDAYSGASGPMMQNFGSGATVPDFGSLDLGNTDYLNGLDKSISDMRTGLTSALQGLFGNGGSMDMSLKGIVGRFNDTMKKIEQARNTAVAAAETARAQEYKAAETQRSALTPAEQAIKDLQEGGAQENLMRNKQSAEEALAAAQKIRNTKQRNAAVQAAQQQLNEALRAIQLDQLQKQAEIERKAADDAYTDRVTAADKKYNDAVTEADRLYQLAVESAQAEYDREVEANKKAEEEAVRNNDFIREGQRVLLSDMLDRLTTTLDQKKVNWKKFQGDLKTIMNDPKFAEAFKNSGANLGSEFAKGLKGAKDKIETALQEVARLVEKYLKLHSPSEVGPMSDLNRWWKAFDDTLMDGFDEKGLARNLNKTISSIPYNVSASGITKPGDGMMSIMPVSKGTGAPATINITVNGSVIQERDLAESIREELIKIGRRDGTIFGGIV